MTIAEFKLEQENLNYAEYFGWITEDQRVELEKNLEKQYLEELD